MTDALALAAGFRTRGAWLRAVERVRSSSAVFFDDLKGPAAGKVELPLHVAWSWRVYDVGTSGGGQRLVLNALLLAEAQREDLEQLLLHGICWLRSHSAQASAGRASRVSGQY